MCTLEHREKVNMDGSVSNGSTIVRLGFKEYASIATIFVTCGTLMCTAMLFVVSLMLGAHTEQRGIHQTPAEKSILFDQARATWMSEVDLRIRIAIAERDSVWEQRLAAIEKNYRYDTGGTK